VVPRRDDGLSAAHTGAGKFDGSSNPTTDLEGELAPVQFDRSVRFAARPVRFITERSRYEDFRKGDFLYLGGMATGSSVSLLATLPWSPGALTCERRIELGPTGDRLEPSGRAKYSITRVK
jgi:hypothetical protein